MIKEATLDDKTTVLKFCKNTFSWGDYISEVWDYWQDEGNLFVFKKNLPIGICHAVFQKGHVWIEGIRVNPEFKRQGIASKLIKHVESLAIQKQVHSSLMLIDTQNKPSLEMSQNLGYTTYQTWNFYSLLPKKNTSFDNIYENTLKENEFPHYVKSWRWVPLEKESISLLKSKNCIIHSGDDHKATAILEDSEHFKKTLIVTLFAGSDLNTTNLLYFLQNYGYEKKYQRVQLLTKEILPEFENLEFKLSFHLMQKLLS